eukprot:2352430-Prymnesium_polylepis.2
MKHTRGAPFPSCGARRVPPLWASACLALAQSRGCFSLALPLVERRPQMNQTSRGDMHHVCRCRVVRDRAARHL